MSGGLGHADSWLVDWDRVTLDTVLLTEREIRAAHRADTYKEREQTERERADRKRERHTETDRDSRAMFAPCHGGYRAYALAGGAGRSCFMALEGEKGVQTARRRGHKPSGGTQCIVRAAATIA